MHGDIILKKKLDLANFISSASFLHPVLSLSKKKKNQWKCCIKPLIRVEHIRIILHAQSGSCYAAAYVVPLAPDPPPSFICAQAENAACAGRRFMQCVRGEWRRGAKPARLSVTGSQAEEIQMGPPFLHSLPWAFFFDDALFIYYCYYLCCAALAKVIPTSCCSPSATASSGRQTSRQPNKPAADTLFTCFFF